MRKPFVPFVLVTILVAIGCAGPAADTDVARTAPSQTYTMEQFMKTVSIGGSSFNADETKLLVSSNETGVFNVYELDLATGSRTAVTEGDDTTFAVAYMPDDERILFSRDQEGNENNHLYLRDPDGTVTDLTEGEETKEQFVGFSSRPPQANGLPQRHRFRRRCLDPRRPLARAVEDQHHQRFRSVRARPLEWW